MAIKIRNFAEIEQFIKQNPNRAMEESARWSEFARRQPIVHQFQTAEQFYGWADANPQLAVDPDIWRAREVQAAFSEIRYNNVRSQYGEPPARGGGGAGPAGLLAAPLALFMRNRPEIIEDDSKFKKIQEQLKNQWIKDNPGKTLDSQEGLDYVYGSLDDENAVGLDEQAERLFREKHQKEAEKFDKKRLKVYKNAEDDPALRWTKERMAEHARARYNLLSRSGATVNWEETSQKIGQREWDKFIAMHPEKAGQYATDKRYAKFLEKNPGLPAALARVEEKRVMEGQQIEAWGETGAPTVEEYQPLVEPSPDEESYEPPSPPTQPAISPDKLAASPNQPARQEKAPHKPSTGGLPNPKTLLNKNLPLPRLPKGLATLVKKVRFIANIAKLFANPVGAGVLIAIVLITVFVLIILLIPQSDTDRFSEEDQFPVPTLPAGRIASCPVTDGKITTHSYKYDPANGHCGEGYTRAGFKCDINSRRAKSIDVLTNGRDVALPSIENQVAQWEFVQTFPIADNDCEKKDSDGKCGIGLSFQANIDLGQRWTLHLIHMDKTIANSLTPGAQYSSGTTIGPSAIGHVHVTIGRNVKNQFAQIDSGWIPAEDLGMCVN